MACLGGLVVTRAARADVTLRVHRSSTPPWSAGRSYWLGEPLAIPLHRLESGALLLFAFFMISDPKTTPDSRAGRLLFAALVAAGAWYVQFRLFRTNGLLWSLAACSLARAAHRSPAARLAVRVARLRGSAASARLASPTRNRQPSNQLRLRNAPLHSVRRARRVSLGFAEPLRAFCGFYVAKADTKLFNQASQVVLVRDGDRTVLTMANDFKGEPKEFAVVIPVPTFLTREQIHVGEKALDRSPRRLLGAAAGRVLRREPVPRCYEMLRPMAMAAPAMRPTMPRRHATREGARRHHRGAVHRRRVRHPDPLGAAEHRPRDLATRERLPDSRRRRRRCSAATSARTCGSSWPR